MDAGRLAALDPFTRYVTIPIMWMTFAAIAVGAFLLNPLLGIFTAWLVLLLGAGLQSQMSRKDPLDPWQ